MKALVATSLALCSGLQFRTQTQRATPSPDAYHLQLKVDAEIANGFRSRSLVEPFDDRLAGLSQASSGDPCAATILAGGLGTKSGFGSRAILAASEIQLALYFNLSFAVCDGDATHPGIAWDEYFENVAGLSVCSDPVKCLRSETSAGWIGNNMTGQLKRVDEQFQVKLLQTIMRSLYTFRSDTLTRAKDALRIAGLEVGAQYVGVHMRRGDKGCEARVVPSEEYAALVRKKLLELKIGTVFVASDDRRAGEELLAALRPFIPGVRVIQLFSEASIEREHYDDNSDMAMALLTDIFALSQAKVFVGTQSSSMSRLVYFLSGEDVEVLSMDGTWLKWY